MAEHVTITGEGGRIDARAPAQHVGIVTGIVTGAAYGGAYEVTPAATEQTLPTAGKFMARDVTVGAIPSNYGLITWNGQVLTVS